MISSYDKEYKEHAVKNFAGATDYALRIKKESEENFFSLFIEGGVAEGFERGEAEILTLPAVALYERITGKRADIEYNSLYTSPEYTAAELLAEFQYSSSRSFYEILALVPFSHIIAFEGREEDMSAEFFKRLKGKRTNLEYLRASLGLSQAELASLSGVDIRSIQTYEQRRNDIFKAQYNILNALAKALYCTVDELTDSSSPRLLTLNDGNAEKLFINEAMWEIKRLRRAEKYFTPAMAAREERKYFYVYRFFTVFPAKRVFFDNGEYKMDSGVLFSCWKKYWGEVVSSMNLPSEKGKTLKEKVYLLCPRAEYDISLSPAEIVRRAFSAMSLIAGE